jgi:hypothetical protein
MKNKRNLQDRNQWFTKPVIRPKMNIYSGSTIHKELEATIPTCTLIPHQPKDLK